MSDESQEEITALKELENVLKALYPMTSFEGQSALEAAFDIISTSMEELES